MVGEGVMLECLESGAVEKVLSVSRKPTNHTHPKLEQLLVPDFRTLSDVEAIRKKQPQAEVYVYPDAQHGFHCDERASFNKDASTLAWTRSMDFLAKHMK